MITLRSANAELKTGLRQLKKAEDSFKEQLPDIRSNIQEMRAYMQEFPMGRLQDMSLRGLVHEGDLADLKTRVQKLESK